MSCDFFDAYFGATYPDATCIDGYLWDLDSCDEPGGDLTSGGDVPCPQCNHALWLERFEEEVYFEGIEAAEQGMPRCRQHRPVKCEQPEDRAKLDAWYFNGYDKCIEEQLATP